MTESYFQDIIIPSFAWLVFAIILGAFLALVWRTYRAFKDDDFKLRVNETLGLPKGTIRSFIIITFTAIMFLIFFGDIDGVEIPVEDRKWFLTAYASLLAFYFGSKYLPDRTTARGLVISSISTPVGHPPTGADSVREAIEITGNGFESPKSVAFNQQGAPSGCALLVHGCWTVETWWQMRWRYRWINR